TAPAVPLATRVSVTSVGRAPSSVGLRKGMSWFASVTYPPPSPPPAAHSHGASERHASGAPERIGARRYALPDRGVRLEPTTLASGRPECRPPRKADRRKPYRVRPPRAMRSRVSIGFRSGPRGRRRGERNGRLPVLQDRFW